MTLLSIEEMRSRFGPNLQENELLSRHTTARVGGPADFLLTVDSVQALAQAVMFLWHQCIGERFWSTWSGAAKPGQADRLFGCH